MVGKCTPEISRCTDLLPLQFSQGLVHDARGPAAMDKRDPWDQMKADLIAGTARPEEVLRAVEGLTRTWSHESVADALDDLLHFLLAEGAPAKIAAIRDLRGYCLRSIANALHNAHRSQDRRVTAEAHASEPAAPAEEPLDALLREELSLRVRSAVESLPMKYYLVLKYSVDGLRVPQIRRQLRKHGLHLTVFAVESALKRARQTVRAALRCMFTMLTLVILVSGGPS